MNDHQFYTDTPEQKLRRVKRRRFWLVVKRGIFLPVILLIIAALTAGILLIPFVPVYGSSMAPTLAEGDICIAFTEDQYAHGDLIAFRRAGKVMIRRVIAGPGSLVSIDESGNVTVDGSALEERYLSEKTLGQCNISFPYRVPEGQYFVLGDNRAEAVDSRSTVVGCVKEDEIIGRLAVQVWPFDEWRVIDQQG